MRDERFNAIRQVRRAVLPTETSAYNALGHIGMLLHATCAARDAVDVPFAMSQEPINLIVQAAADQAAICDRILAIHKSLAVAGAVAVPEIAWGDTTPCPSQASIDDAERPINTLRAVG